MRDKIKVALVGPIDTKGRYKGGISYIINNLLESDITHNSHLTLLSFDTCRIERGDYTTGGLSIENIKNAIYTVKDLRYFLKINQPEILYYNSSRGIALIKDLIILSRIRNEFSGKIIFHIHFAEVEKIVPSNKLLRRLFLGLIESNTDHIVLLSQKTKEQFMALGIPNTKISVIYNFHNLAYSDAQINKKLERKGETLKLIFLGSLDERKGIIDLFDAIVQVDRMLELHICGSPKNRSTAESIKQRVIDDKKDQIYMHGYVEGDEKKQLLLNADILVLPSYGEGFPIVLSEGLAAGCMLITTNVGAIPEVFSDKNGRILSPGDIKGIANAIEELYESDAREQIIRYNLELAEQLSLSQYIREIEKVCMRVNDET